MDKVQYWSKILGQLLVAGPFLLFWIVAWLGRKPKERIFGFGVQGMILVLFYQLALGLRSLVFLIWLGTDSNAYAYTSIVITILYLVLGSLNATAYFLEKGCLKITRNILIDRLSENSSST